MTGFDIFISYLFVFGLGLLFGAQNDAEDRAGGGVLLCVICIIIEVTRFLTFVNIAK